MNVRVAATWFVAIVLAAALLGTAHTAEAATTRTWTGNGTTDNWTDANNWGGIAPAAGDSLIFPATANRKSNVNDYPADTTFSTITLNGSGYTLNGNSIIESDEIINQPSSGTNTITFDINGPATISQVSGKLILSGDNDFTGDVNIGGGSLVALSDTALGQGLPSGETYVDSDAALVVAGGIDSPEGVNIGGLGLGGDGVLQSANGTNRLAQVRMDGPTRIGVGNSTLVVQVLTVTASGATLELVGGGKLQVEDSFLTGTVEVTDGNLTWNAASQVFVNVRPDGWLRGTGLVSQADVYGGVIWPGSGNAPGMLSVFNATTFHSGYFRVDIDGPGAGTGYGQLATNGLTLNPLATVLELDITTTPSVGDVFRIIDNTGGSPVSGTFLDLPEGAIFIDSGYAWKISYTGGTGNDVTLTVLRQASADLMLQLSGSLSPVSAGGQIIYTIVVTNEGPDAASSPTVSMGTPVGTTFVSSTKPANWTCSIPAPGPTVSCTGPTLAAGDAVTITLTFKVNVGSAGAVTATAGVSSQTNDPFSADNSVTLVTPIGAADPRPFKLFAIGVARD
jgi:uncharacterized repeat protein (TIGR01451 family)